MFVCVHVGVFPSAWYGNVREIAAKSPLLLSGGAEQYLDTELELNHPLKIENIAPVSDLIMRKTSGDTFITKRKFDQKGASLEVIPYVLVCVPYYWLMLCMSSFSLYRESCRRPSRVCLTSWAGLQSWTDSFTNSTSSSACISSPSTGWSLSGEERW